MKDVLTFMGAHPILTFFLFCCAHACICGVAKQVRRTVRPSPPKETP